MESQTYQQDRQIRVFISSTFRDMQEERDVLMKFVFPQLRKLCEERGVTFTEVDLRWGITEEQSQRGEVLPICLAEIERCRPFFIGILGERYGWVPAQIPQELVELQPWLAEYGHKSVTELEIIHGVLANPEMANRACFFFRDPSYVDTLPPEKQADCREMALAPEIAEYGREEAERHAAEHRKKLAGLKELIREESRQDRLALRENYRDPKALGELVREHLTTVINQEFPPGPAPDPLDREAALHEAFGRHRTVRQVGGRQVGVYIGRQVYFARLDKHAASTTEPLVILGESGLGKSALLANWVTQYRQSHGDDFVLLHFIGASADSSNWAAMLRRIMGELKRRFNIQQDLPVKLDELRPAFANWLHMASARGRTVLVIDALNQLDDLEGAPDLVWLPPVIPENIRLIVSALPGRPLDDLKKRGWPTLRIKPLLAKERARLIVDFLGQFTKRLGDKRVRRIAGSAQAANPLYLRALLEELRVFGVHERLDERIKYYLTATTVPDLYQRILERYEQDYDAEGSGLVRDAMSLIWASRYGLSEQELLDLLRRDGQPLPQARWSALYLAVEQSLIRRGGLIGFSHDYFRDAVRDRYLNKPHAPAAAHVRLADFFQTRDSGTRRIDELPWQLSQSKWWQRLYDLLADLSFFTTVWDASEFDVKIYWAELESEGKLSPLAAYREVLASPATFVGPAQRIATLLYDAGKLTEGAKIREALAQHFRTTADAASLQRSLGDYAAACQGLGDTARAFALCTERVKLCRAIGDQSDLQEALNGLANNLYNQGSLEEASDAISEQEAICRQTNHLSGLCAALLGKATVMHSPHVRSESVGEVI